jgi:GT2 family glycosyltransferase
MNKPLVSIVILNFNREIETCRLISSILKQTYTNYEIIILDNGSKNSSIEYIKNYNNNLKIILLDKNYGCPGGRNLSIKYCKGEYILFCDNDGILHQEALKNSLELILTDPYISVIGGVVKEFENINEVDTNCKLENNFFNSSIFVGTLSLHTKSSFTDISYYPDNYYYGAEETYLSYRILDSGYKILVSDNFMIWHKKSIIERNLNKETISKWFNQLYNSYQLFPIEIFILYFIYFNLFYPLYAFKYSLFFNFYKVYLNKLSKLYTYKRKPIKRSTFYNTFFK